MQKREPPSTSQRPPNPEEQKRTAVGLIGGGVMGGLIGGPPGALAGFVIGGILAAIANEQEKRKGSR